TALCALATTIACGTFDDDSLEHEPTASPDAGRARTLAGSPRVRAGVPPAADSTTLVRGVDRSDVPDGAGGAGGGPGQPGDPSDSCPGTGFVLIPGGTPVNLVGTTAGATDMVVACGVSPGSGPDRIYAF